MCQSTDCRRTLCIIASLLFLLCHCAFVHHCYPASSPHNLLLLRSWQQLVLLLQPSLCKSVKKKVKVYPKDFYSLYSIVEIFIVLDLFTHRTKNLSGHPSDDRTLNLTIKIALPHKTQTWSTPQIWSSSFSLHHDLTKSRFQYLKSIMKSERRRIDAQRQKRLLQPKKWDSGKSYTETPDPAEN